MTLQQNYVEKIYGIAILSCFLPFISPALALLVGIAFSLLNIKSNLGHKYTALALQFSIVLMGFGMNFTQVIHASKSGVLETAISVTFVMVAGILLGRLFKTDSKTALLISAGTAICGGSAIAAVAPVLNAKNHQISFSLVVIFMLNALALILFPFIGHMLGLSEETFGNWAAIAIHDTSSVVGAGATYGPKALEVATTIKLIRALWIIPLSIVIAFFNQERSTNKIKIPWFIFLFAGAILFAHFFPGLEDTFQHFKWLGRRGMVIALFLIGSNISVKEAKQAGAKSFLLGVFLWIITASTSLFLLTLK